MGALATTYYEAIADDSTASYTFDQSGGTARCQYIIGKMPISSSGSVVTSSPAVSSASQLQQVIEDLIGYTNYDAGPTQALRRTIPVTHPAFPYLYGTRVSSLTGKGSKTAVQSFPQLPTNPSIGVKPIANYYLYETYLAGVEFSSRPYPILEDTAFTNTMSGSWFKDDGSSESFNYAPEWCRYTTYDLTPQDNTIQGQQGELVLVVNGSSCGFVPFNSPPWMWLPDQLLKIKWYQVPYRFIKSNNSYIAGGNGRQWRGRINQNTWWNWPAGSLLYLGYSVSEYTPPNNIVGTYSTYGGNVDYNTGAVTKTSIGTLVNYERLCDIELTFLLTDRKISGTIGTTITNKNYIPAGHNLLPNLADGKFYYAVRTPITLSTGGSCGYSAKEAPPWLSFPVEALFSDPDVAGGPT